MYVHPHFDLRLFDDDELGNLLGSPVTERRTMHEWPLSCVQRVTDASGRHHIYKAQREPSLEDRFYAAARSSLLPGLEAAYREGQYLGLIIEYFDGMSMAQAELTPDATLALACRLLKRIETIKGELPIYQRLDLAHWAAFRQELLDGLWALVNSGAFEQVGRAEITTIQATLESQDVLDRVGGDVGLLHGDLTPDNILVTKDDYRIIDWQFPRIGPPQVDLATLLSGLGIDPRPHVEAGIVPLLELIRIHWLMACARRWFPAGTPTYDREIARLVLSL